MSESQEKASLENPGVQTHEGDDSKLALEKQRARERLRYVKPQIAGKVLGHDRYWTPQFLELYLERCDETAFVAPSDAYLLAQHLPELARRIRVGAKAQEWDTPLDKMDGIVRALAVKGSCCRVAGETEEAELCFTRAFRGLQGKAASLVAMSELHRRYAALLATSGRTGEAAEHLEKGLEFAEQGGFSAGAADGLALRGFLYAESDAAAAVMDFLQAARLADRKTPRGMRTIKASLHNIVATVAQGKRNISLKDQEKALKALQVYKDELKGQPTGLRKMRAFWIEGLFLSNLRIERHARRQLSKARSGFLRLDAPLEYLIVSIELIQHLLWSGDTDEARAVAKETRTMIDRERLNETQLSILDAWLEADLTEDGARTVRQQLIAASRPS